MNIFIRRATLAWLLCLAVALFTAAPGHARSVTLAWDANTEPDIAGYKIYYRSGDAVLPFDGTGAAQGPSPVDVGKNLGATLSDLSDGQTWYFSVTAYNSAGYESSFSNTVASPPPAVSVNGAPALAPIAPQTVAEGSALSFTVNASDPDGDPLTYSASGLPAGAIFTPSTRTFAWTPLAGSAGNYSVTFTASDGKLVASEPVAITVVLPRWKVRATAGTGGKITPSGDLTFQTGSNQVFTLTPDSGYVIQDLRINGASVGGRQSYTLTSIAADHTLEAVFKVLPSGLSFVAGETGIPGVERTDGGVDGNNLVAGKPSPNVEYLFRVVYRDLSVQVPLKIFLKLNDYAHEMVPADGEIGTGALYVYKTRLGPAPAHSFRFEARDPGGNVIWTLPEQGEIAGPRVELLSGRNLVGVPGDASTTYLNSTAALGIPNGYRWRPAGTKSSSPGVYRLIDSTGAVLSGEGYMMRRETGTTLPEPGHPEIAAGNFTVRLKAGWNLIANPYRGNIPLDQVKVKRGGAAPVPWAKAAADGWVAPGLYQYQGNEADTYGFESALAAPDPPIVVPWFGYWVYLKRTDSNYSLIFPRPQQ